MIGEIERPTVQLKPPQIIQRFLVEEQLGLQFSPDQRKYMHLLCRKYGEEVGVKELYVSATGYSNVEANNLPINVAISLLRKRLHDIPDFNQCEIYTVDRDSSYYYIKLCSREL